MEIGWDLCANPEVDVPVEACTAKNSASSFRKDVSHRKDEAKRILTSAIILLLGVHADVGVPAEKRSIYFLPPSKHTAQHFESSMGMDWQEQGGAGPPWGGA
jgi:hypothetical protein